MSRRVSSADRKRDLAAVVLLVVGAALFGYGFLRLHAMATRPIIVPRGTSAIAMADTRYRIAAAGAALIVVGVGAAGWSFWRHRRHDTEP